eukprot:jgi/Mesen1/4481/ME000228S03456
MEEADRHSAGSPATAAAAESAPLMGDDSDGAREPSLQSPPPPPPPARWPRATGPSARLEGWVHFLPKSMAAVLVVLVLLLALLLKKPGLRSAALHSLAINPLLRPRVPRPAVQCVPTAVPVPELGDMTLEEKVGQMTQVDKNALAGRMEDVSKFFLGSILSGGGGAPDWGNEAADWADMVESFQEATRGTRLRIPMLYGVDAVHGHNNVLSATIFPHHVALGATRNPALMRDIGAACARVSDGDCAGCDALLSVGQAAAQEVAATGIRWAFSPAVSVCKDPRWGRCYESFSDETSVVQTMMRAEIDGLQRFAASDASAADPSLANVPGSLLVAACAKHFIGDGATAGGVDQGDARVSEEELRRVHLPPYVDAIARGVASVMVSYSSWNGAKMHAHRHLLSDVLKGELGFPGVLVSDWEALQKMPGNWPRQVGGFVLVPARAVRESLVLLKNERRAGGGAVFPLPLEGQRVLVAGTHAHNIGLQCGGWSIAWQGLSGNITRGTTVLEGILAATAGAAAHVEYVETPTGREEADYAVVVVGEGTYAEWFGDDKRLRLSREALHAVRSLSARMPCVVVLITGRPLVLDDGDNGGVLSAVDALVVAWLPGSEGGAGVADALFDEGFEFSGTLPREWVSAAQLSASKNELGASAPLFSHGYGLDKRGRPLSQPAMRD